MIELRKVSRTYQPKKGQAVQALKAIDLTLDKTGMVFILGKSGSGKSTLLNIVGGLDKPDNGEMLVNGKTLSSFTQAEYDSYRNTFVGFIFQEYNVLDELTVAQNIGIALELQGKKATSEDIQKILSLVDLIGYETRKPNELSGGQKQRVAIARALVKNPDIIMADEPTGALDSDTGKQVFETLEKLSRERLVIVVSHDREFAKTYGSRIVEFKDGNIISDVSKTKHIDSESDLKFAINEDGIDVEDGYILTKEDLKIIHDYYTKGQSASLNRLKKSDFKETGTVHLNYTEKELKLIKSHLPIKDALLMGLRNLKHKKVRLIFSILLSAVALILFGIADTFASYDQYTAAVETIKSSNIDYLTFSKSLVHRYENGYSSITTKFGALEVDEINQQSDNIYYHPLHEKWASFDVNVNDVVSSYQQRYYTLYSSRVTPIDQAALEKLNMTLVEGVLPVADDEVAMTVYQYETFKMFGYLDTETNERVAINSYADLIGKKFIFYDRTVYVTGIINTHFNKEKFLPLITMSDSDISYNLLRQQLNDQITNNIHNAMFVSFSTLSRMTLVNGRSLNDLWIEFSFDVEDYGYFNGPNTFYWDTEMPDQLLYFFGDVTRETMTSDDILISLWELSQMLERIDGARIYSEVENYLLMDAHDEMLHTDADIYEALVARYGSQNIVPLEEWNEVVSFEAREIFAQIAYEYFLIGLDYPYGLTYNEIFETIIEPHLAVLNPIDTDIMIYSQYGENSVEKNGRIVGVHIQNYEYDNIAVVSKVAMFSEFNIQDTNGPELIVTYVGDYNDAKIRQIIDLHYLYAETYDYMVNLTNIYVIDSFNNGVQAMAIVALSIGGFFTIFAALLLYNFISTSIAFKRKEIGILRSIGARSVDVLKIFLSEAFAISLMNFVIAVSVTPICISLLYQLMSSSLKIDLVLFVFSIRQILLIFAISIGSAVLSTALPIARIAFKKPIDIINAK